MASSTPPFNLTWDNNNNLWPCLDCCRKLWIPQLAIFGGPDCVAIIGWIPACISLAVLLLRYGLRPLWRRRPIWLRDFAAEDMTDGLSAAAAAAAAADDLLIPSKHRRWAFSAIALLLNSAIGIAVCTIAAISSGPFFLIPLIPHIITCTILAIERPRSTPGALVIIQGLLLLTQLIMLSTAVHILSRQALVIWGLEMCIPLASLTFIANMPMRDPDWDADDICPAKQTPTSALRSPEDIISLWGWMSISWMGPTVNMGCERQLHDEDVWKLPLSFQHERLHLLFRDLEGSVLARVMKANAPDLIITTLLGITESLCTLIPIVFLKQLLSALELPTGPNRQVAVVYGIFILLVRLVGAQAGIFNLWYCRRAYERSRGEMITMIYEKTLMRKAFTFPSEHEEDADPDADAEKDKAIKDGKPGVGGPASMGKILNLMRNDVYEISQRFWEFANLFTKPMTFVLTIVLIWKILGPAALGGVLLIVSAQVVNSLIIRSMVRWERARRAVTDAKLQVTTQFVEAIRHLRWYDWQDRWLGQILAARTKELRYRVIVNLISKAITAVNQFSSYTFPVAAFYAYTVVGGRPLRIDVAFPALTLFNQLNSSLKELPGLITVLLNASVAMGRIESFMAEPNKEEKYPGTPSNGDLGGGGGGGAGCQPPASKLEMTMRGASFSWPGTGTQVLSNVSFSAAAGLTAVCGKVGAGKTALLHAVLGELDEDGGVRRVPNEMIGYCAQTPWLQSMSIRENILFSSGYDEERYAQVLAACCLVPDLQNWKARDLSMIGENGVGLSGGQKARVALARAIYSQARILLLDDPIAALDHGTAEDILRNLFTRTDLMKDRLVVFVTHRMDLVTRYASQVLEISQSGTVTVISREEISAHEELLHFTAAKNERRDSVDEQQPTQAADEDVIAEKFIEEEHRAHGGVMFSVYWQYIKAGNLRYWLFLMFVFIIFRAFRLSHFYFIKLWGEAYTDASSPSSAAYSTSQVVLAAPGGLEHSLHAANTTTISVLASGDAWWHFDLNLPPPDQDARPWLFWFFMIAIGQFIAYVLGDLTIVLLIYTAGKHLFEEVMHKVASATFRFYDVTPVGRLMNRLTSDIGTIDGQIVSQIRDVVWYFMFWSTSLFVIASTTPVFLGIAVLMTSIFILIFLRFLPASQSLRRLEMVSLSPLMSNFGTLLEGLTTVRAFRAQPHFQRRIVQTTDAFQRMDHFYWSLQMWLQFRFDALSALTTFVLTMSALASGLGAGTVGFVLATAGNFVNCTHQLCRKYGELQMQFVSVERVIELMGLEEEPRGRVAPPAAWPGYGDDVVFDDVTVRYAPGLDPSLRGLSFRIPAGSTVAVTGRTGSGKSTLALALLGTVLPERGDGDGDGDGAAAGSIHIGSIDVAAVDKHALRRRISFVAQDPVLFPGSLRDNLDPLGEHSEEECALVLRRVLGAGREEAGLAVVPEEEEEEEVVEEEGEEGEEGEDDPVLGMGSSSSSSSSGSGSRSSSSSSSGNSHDGAGGGGAGVGENGQTTTLTSGHATPTPTTAAAGKEPSSSTSSSSAPAFSLATRVDGGGRNLSQGQRQLVGLGRAVLRRSAVVILDEATASIDAATALYIQTVLREELRESTVITIAHRVEAVRDADFEVVLDRGALVRARRIGPPPPSGG